MDWIIDGQRAIGETRGRQATYPYRLLQRGDSFFVPGAKNLNLTTWAKTTGHKFTRRKTTENGIAGIRVWRVS